MKNKIVLIAISATAIGVIIMLLVMKKQADIAREISNDIMEDFKRVDESLQRTNDSLIRFYDSGVGALRADTNTIR